MPYTVTPTPLEGVLLLEPKVFGDVRGWFFEAFNARDFARATGLERTFVQDNHSHSTRGVLRGLHHQVEHPQGKLIRVTQGAVFDVAVDIRPGSATYGRWFGVELTGENRRQLWIPEGLAHGFLVLSEVAELLYKSTDYWHPEHERSLHWADPTLAIDWPLHRLDGPPQLVPRDASAGPFVR